MLARKSPSIVVFAILVTAMLCVASCTTTTTRYQNVPLKTARAIGGVTPEQVKVSNLHTWMGWGGGGGFTLSVSPVGGSWEAETPKGHYVCVSNDMLRRRVNCIKQ
jgi:hypothetical protein